jgi:hypothetical protein
VGVTYTKPIFQEETERNLGENQSKYKQSGQSGKVVSWELPHVTLAGKYRQPALGWTPRIQLLQMRPCRAMEFRKP